MENNKPHGTNNNPTKITIINKFEPLRLAQKRKAVKTRQQRLQQHNRHLSPGMTHVQRLTAAAQHAESRSDCNLKIMISAAIKKRILQKITRGSVVVKALCYELEGRGFQTPWSEFLNLPNPSSRIRKYQIKSLRTVSCLRWGPPSLICNAYRGPFHGGKAAGS
jgi:hypothetical protein